MKPKKPLNFLKSFKKPVSFMEVCGSHTMAISKSGIRSIIPKNIRLVSGPGCPVCVTPTADIDKAIELSKIENIIIATFGDMLKVPGSSLSLDKARAKGADIRIVYSPDDAVTLAQENPMRQVVFIGVGFETTSPTIAASILIAKNKNLKNFSVISFFKLIPPALKLLVDAKETKIDGFILPGHVSAVIGTQAYRFLSVPGVVTGFSGRDVLDAIEMLVGQIENGQSDIEVQYKNVVLEKGNPEAVKVLYSVFEPCDSRWRGIGWIPMSGMKIRKEFEEFDAEIKFNIKTLDVEDPIGCECGNILKGIKMPSDCALFGSRCTPSDPVGPCMVSSEGACSAHYKYGNN